MYEYTGIDEWIENTCWRCGAKKNYLTSIKYRYYCDSCKEEVAKEYDSMLKEFIRLKTLIMLEKAQRILEGQEIDMKEYIEAIEAVKEKALQDSRKFESAYEMVAALVLIINRVKVKMQYPIKSFNVDFLIPSLKVVLEIDGSVHKPREKDDNRRDIIIREVLGKDWEVIRIPTKYLYRNAELLLEAIIEIKAQKQKARASNHGILPIWFSNRETKEYQAILPRKNDELDTRAIVEEYGINDL